MRNAWAVPPRQVNPQVLQRAARGSWEQQGSSGCRTHGAQWHQQHGNDMEAMNQAGRQG